MKLNRQTRRKAARQAKNKPQVITEPGIYDPEEFIAAVTDNEGRLDLNKWNALYDKHGDDVSIKGPPGIADFIKRQFYNGFRYAGFNAPPGQTAGLMSWVRDERATQRIKQGLAEEPSDIEGMTVGQKLQRDMDELKITDPQEQAAYVELMRRFREENGRATQDYYGVEAHNYGSKRALASLQKKFAPIFKHVPPIPYGYNEATESSINGDGDMLMNAVHTTDKALALKVYNEMCELADEVFLMKWCEVFAQPGTWDHQTIQFYEKPDKAAA